MKIGMIAAIAILLTACAKPDGFERATKLEWCIALTEDAPTASMHDTQQTTEEVADIGDTIDLLCAEILTSR